MSFCSTISTDPPLCQVTEGWGEKWPERRLRNGGLEHKSVMGHAGEERMAAEDRAPRRGSESVINLLASLRGAKGTLTHLERSAALSRMAALLLGGGARGQEAVSRARGREGASRERHRPRLPNPDRAGSAVSRSPRRPPAHGPGPHFRRSPLQRPERAARFKPARTESPFAVRNVLRLIAPRYVQRYVLLWCIKNRANLIILEWGS